VSTIAAIVLAKMICTYYRLKLLPLEFSDTRIRVEGKSVMHTEHL